MYRLSFGRIMPLLAGIFGSVADASRFLPNRGILCRLRETPSDHRQPKEGHLSVLANLTSAAVKPLNVPTRAVAR